MEASGLTAKPGSVQHSAIESKPVPPPAVRRPSRGVGMARAAQALNVLLRAALIAGGVMWTAAGVFKVLDPSELGGVVVQHGVLGLEMRSASAAALALGLFEAGLGVACVVVAVSKRLAGWWAVALISGGLMLCFVAYTSRVPAGVFAQVGCGCKGTSALVAQAKSRQAQHDKAETLQRQRLLLAAHAAVLGLGAASVRRARAG